MRIAPCLVCVILAAGCVDDDGLDGDDGKGAPDVRAAADTTNASDTPGEVTGPALPFFDACEPSGAPDPACYASKRDPGSDAVALAEAIAERYIDVHPAAEQEWNWEPSVVMFALLELHRVSGNPSLLAYVKAWLDHHIDAGYDIYHSDTAAPAITATLIFAETGDERYRAVVTDVLAYLKDVPRSEHGGISHLGLLLPDNPTLWLDSLFMFGVTLTRWAEVTGDVSHLDALAEQIRIFSEVLQDPGGWYTHAWNWSLQEQEPGVFWCRGNAWLTVALHDYLRARRLRGESDATVTTALDAQVGAILRAQQPETGLWSTVVNRPTTSYPETSCSALFAYGLARGYRYGLRDAAVLDVVRAAMAGVRAKVVNDPDGRPVVTGTSGPTSVGTGAHYEAIETADDLAYGVGAVILALLETSGLP